ncbi:cytochrome P450 [Nesidiocoris tenuis]|nr:cytochrome P450 [Nesidiocoris tenuis]
MLLILLAVAFATFAAYAYKVMRDANKYWAEKGIKTPKPLLFFGNSWPTLTRTKSMVDQFNGFYNQFPNEPCFGVYDFLKPMLVVKDVELVERVLIKDFHHFVDRGFTPEETSNPLELNLFNMSGKKWKAMRSKFSPMFTTGKLRHMVPQINEVSEALMKKLESNNRDVDMKDMMQRFSMDVIASTAFGITVNCMEETEESEFRKMGKLAFKFTYMALFRFFMLTCFPKVAKKIKIAQNDPRITKYFSKVLRETLHHRKNTSLTRNDFVQLMVTLQQKGDLEFEGDRDDDYLITDNNEEKKMEHLELTDDVMIGQAFVFLVAGFEATATTLMYACFELASNPECQKKARKEIVKAVEARNGVLDYDAIKEMPYLNQCINETMRIHSFIAVLFRSCTKEYTFPGTSLTLQPGQGVYIPVTGIHQDPNLYPDPELFKPERFGPDVSRPSCSFIPFGDGPRICIAMRFALTEVKVCIARLLMEYEIELSPKTKLPLDIDPTSFSSMPKTPVYFNMTKIKS